MPTVAVIVGSLRRDSVNRRLAEALARLAAPQLEFVFVEIGDIPLYNYDLEKDMPAPVARLKAAVEAADAVLFVTPEYNRSIPGVLKNVIDWGSRPPGKNSWGGKPAAIVGSSPGAIGTAAAQVDLRHILLAINVHVMGQPQVYFVHKDELLTPEGEITNDGTRAFLQGWADTFATWIERLNRP